VPLCALASSIQKIFNQRHKGATQKINMILQRRNRILRQSPAIRSMVAETILNPADFIAPLFIDEGTNISTEILPCPAITAAQ
jgi:delta-aminolevulinic acid dehydratase/porphobilinogen synthase